MPVADKGRDEMNSNKWRNWGLVSMFAGFFLMYSSVYDKALIPFFLPIGSIGVLIGIGTYFRFGPVNSSIHTIDCPKCGTNTRLTGKYDACSFCKQPLKRMENGTYEPYLPS